MSVSPATLSGDLRHQTFMSFLDLSRWLAAVVVFVSHLRNPLLLGYGDLPPTDRPHWVKLWYFVTGWHAEAVIIFFVLSGLLVGGAGAAKLSQSRFDLRGYSIDRVSRLYVAFLPALILGALLDLAGSHWFAASGFWDHSQAMIAQKIASAPFQESLSWSGFLGNVVMVQDYYVRPFGSNTPLWTISAEFWFYVVFGLCSVFWLGKGPVANLIAVVLMVLVFAGLGTQFLVLLGLWLLGVAIAFVPRLPLHPAFALLLLIAVLVYARLNQASTDDSSLLRNLRNYLVAGSFALLIICMRGRRFAGLERLAGLNRWLADFSFSLYLIHFPLMLFLMAALHAIGFEGIRHGYSAVGPAGIGL